MIKSYLSSQGGIVLRVISGLRKGHRLKSPKSMKIRPTEDRIKESLFNIIGFIDADSIILDAFAGTGSIGIEFLSRGARKAYFVDKSKESIDIIYENLKHTKFMEEAIVLNKDISLAIQSFKLEGLVFDYIYLDPPFRQDEYLSNLIDEISQEKILNKNGIIVVEHEKELILDENILDLYKYDFRNYGSKVISFYRRNI